MNKCNKSNNIYFTNHLFYAKYMQFVIYCIEIYQMSNGERSTREVSAILKNKCSHTKIANLCNKWALLGLVIPATRKGRYKAAFDLDEYGISGVGEEEEGA